MVKVNVIFFVLLAIMMSSCSKEIYFTPADRSGPIVSAFDGAIVRGRAEVTIAQSPKAFGSLKVTPPTTVVYTNASSVTFSINAATLAAGTLTNNVLSLGSVSVTALSDNDLKLCGTGGNQKCNNSGIRVYTTGTTAGFVNTTDLYGVPLFVGTLNPTTAIGLNATGAVYTATYAIPATTHKLNIVNFPTPSYAVTSDFSNAGAGGYTATFVVEYVLLP